MKKEDIEHLALLARIELRDGEAEALSEDITSILEYVGKVKEITATQSGEKSVRPLHNVMREDTEPHEADAYTEALLEGAPERDGRYIKVKKIINDQ